MATSPASWLKAKRTPAPPRTTAAMQPRGSDRQDRAGFSEKDFAALGSQRPDAFGRQRTLRPDIAAGLERIAMKWLRKVRRMPVGAGSRLDAAFG